MLTVNALFDKKIKVVVVERDLPSIMASWLTIIRNQTQSSYDENIRKRGHEANDSNRMAEMWFSMVKDCMEGTQQIKRDVPDQIIVVNYDDLIVNPNREIAKIEEFFELPKHNYDFNNIQNDTADDDLIAWGFEGLHTIRPKLEKTSKDPKEVLGEELYNRFVQLEKDYK